MRQAEPAPAVTFVIPPRANPYDVWQNLAVDRYGRFRPRVILAPQGAYYRYSGEHYPWTATRTLEVMPYLVD